MADDDQTRRWQLLASGMGAAWWAERSPDRLAVISPTGDRTFAELNLRANQLARALRRRGLGRGDAVAMLCTNRAEFVETVAACQRAGFRLTPVNWHLTGDEASYIVDDCEARALIADASIADVAAAARKAAPRCEVGLAVGGDIDGFEDFDAAAAVEDGADLEDPTPGGMMLYTSGTTGRPKGVHRQGRSVAGSTVGVGIYDDTRGDRHLCTGPLYHAAPLSFSLLLPQAFGAGVVLMEHWDAEETLALIERHRVTHTHMVPTMFYRLLALPDDVRSRYDLSSLRYVIHGAAPCPVSVKRRMIDWFGPIIWEYYAATEGVGTIVDAPTWLAHPGTVGRPAPEGSVVVGDDDGKPLPAGETGLVYLKAPAGARFSYFKDPGKTESSYRGEYFTLGDVGHLDEEGYLYLTDRSANLIISGGVNIYPAEVEAVLLDHPAVADAAVIGVEDTEWGESVLAVVEPRAAAPDPGPELAAVLIEHCRSRLAHFKCPRAVEFVDHLPRQDNGKLYKRLLRDRYRDRSASDR